MLKRDVIATLIAGLLILLLFAHYALQGQEVPLWQGLAVAAVNVVAAGRLFYNVQQAKKRSNETLHQQSQASKN